MMPSSTLCDHCGNERLFTCGFPVVYLWVPGSMYVKVFPSVLVPQVEPLLQGTIVPFTNTGAVQFLALSLWAFPPPILDCLLEAHKPFLTLNYFCKQVRTGARVAPRNKTFPIIIVLCIHFIINS